MTLSGVAALMAWGTLVGLDLVSVPQVMIARPLVAGTVAGWLLGDPLTGVTVGAVLELFAFDILPVGAARYPDYGPATVSAVVVATGTGGLHSVGFAVAVGLLVAYAGEYTIQLLRRWNSAVVRRYEAGFARGDPRAIRAAHLGGLARDAGRAALLTAVGLGLAGVARSWPPLGPEDAGLLHAALIGAGLAAAASGTVRAAGRGRGARWFAAGLAGGGMVAAVLR
ncbi:MAG: PTS sugar transporter subunit IIC [Gemmatimonadetes bacterium]|nr:PTS sugar transporter subunit IIC [Gemmatimonadota bacterium]